MEFYVLQLHGLNSVWGGEGWFREIVVSASDSHVWGEGGGREREV